MLVLLVREEAASIDGCDGGRSPPPLLLLLLLLLQLLLLLFDDNKLFMLNEMGDFVVFGFLTDDEEFEDEFVDELDSSSILFS
jgi:hypothetical protein